MPVLFRFAPLALLLLPVLSHAQTSTAGAVGLEIPAPVPPSKGHFLTGAYVAGTYSPLATSAGYGYWVQPFLRYQPGSSARGRLRPFLQYSFAPYRLPSYGAGAFYSTAGPGRPAEAGFAPLAMQSVPLGAGPYQGYGGLGAFSVGIPMHVGSSSAVLNVGGSILEGFLRSAAW